MVGLIECFNLIDLINWVSSQWFRLKDVVECLGITEVFQVFTNVAFVDRLEDYGAHWKLGVMWVLLCNSDEGTIDTVWSWASCPTILWLSSHWASSGWLTLAQSVNWSLLHLFRSRPPWRRNPRCHIINGVIPHFRADNVHYMELFNWNRLVWLLRFDVLGRVSQTLLWRLSIAAECYFSARCQPIFPVTQHFVPVVLVLVDDTIHVELFRYVLKADFFSSNYCPPTTLLFHLSRVLTKFFLRRPLDRIL